jgi:hypothetical protein
LERKAVTAVFSLPVSQAAFSIEQEKALDIYAREALLDRAMGPGRKRKSSEKLRRGRLPAEGLAFAARDAFGNLSKLAALRRCCLARSPLRRSTRAQASARL